MKVGGYGVPEFAFIGVGDLDEDLGEVVYAGAVVES